MSKAQVNAVCGGVLIAVFAAVLVGWMALHLGTQAYNAAQAEGLDHVEGVALTGHGPAVVTDHSLSRLGGSTGQLQSWNGKPNIYSTICDWTKNGVRDDQEIYANAGQWNQYVVNETHDPDGYGGDCGHEMLDHSRSGHQVVSISGGTLSVH